MTTSRIYYQNLLTQSTFSSFNVAGGAVAMAEADPGKVFAYNAGSAVVAVRLNPTTGYTATFEKNFIAAIHSSSQWHVCWLALALGL